MECDGDRLDRQDAWDRDHPDAEEHRERLAARIRVGDRVTPSRAWLRSCGIIDEGIISEFTGTVGKSDELHPHDWRKVTLDNGRRSLDTNLVKVSDRSRELF